MNKLKNWLFLYPGIHRYQLLYNIPFGISPHCGHWVRSSTKNLYRSLEYIAIIGSAKQASLLK